MNGADLGANQEAGRFCGKVLYSPQRCGTPDTMAILALVVVLTMAVVHWFLTPLMGIGTELFNLAPLGWLVLAAAVWLFAGER